MKKYLVIIEETANKHYSAYIPDLPGCIATGKSKSQLEKNIYEAIAFHLEGLAAENMAIPPARSEAQTFVLQDSNSLSSNPVVI